MGKSPTTHLYSFVRNRTSSGGERDTLQTPTTPTKENKYMFDPCSAGANSNITGKLDILYIIIIFNHIISNLNEYIFINPIKSRGVSYIKGKLSIYMYSI